MLHPAYSFGWLKNNTAIFPGWCCQYQKWSNILFHTVIHCHGYLLWEQCNIILLSPLQTIRKFHNSMAIIISNSETKTSVHSVISITQSPNKTIEILVKINHSFGGVFQTSWNTQFQKRSFSSSSFLVCGTYKMLTSLLPNTFCNTVVLLLFCSPSIAVLSILADGK